MLDMWTRSLNLFVLYGRVRQAVNGSVIESYVGVAGVLLAKTKSM